MAAAIARLLASASLPPRRTTALPVFRQIAATSLVTLGRDSYTTPTTPKRHAPLRYGESVGARDPVELLANRICQTRDGLDIARHAGDALRRQTQAIDLDPRGRIRAVLRIGGEDLCLARANRARDRRQRPILEIGRRLREHDRRRLRARRFIDQLVCRYWHFQSLIPNP